MAFDSRKQHAGSAYQHQWECACWKGMKRKYNLSTTSPSNPKTYSVLTEVMSANPSTIEKSLNLLRISRNLERIADLSTNICEDVIFIIEGKIIKHHGIDGLTR
jgi:hypothetical protein